MNEPDANAGMGDTTAGDVAAAGETLLTQHLADDAGEQQGGKPPQDGKQEGNDGQTDNKDAKPEGAPEKYEFAMPDGMQIDARAMADFEPLARELNLSQEQAQKLVDVYARQVLARHEAKNAELEEWVKRMKTDSEIGGAAIDSSLRRAQSVIRIFGTPELDKALKSTGFVNHPEMVRLMARIGKAMAEDAFITGGNASAGPRDPAKVLFPEMS